MSPYIARTAGILGGIPCFAGTRVPVQNLFDYLESDYSLDEFLKDFPTVSPGAAVNVLEEAKCSLLKDAPAT